MYFRSVSWVLEWVLAAAQDRHLVPFEYLLPWQLVQARTFRLRQDVDIGS